MRIFGAICLSATFRLLRFVGGIWLSFPLAGFLVYSVMLLFLLKGGYYNLVFILSHALLAFIVYAVHRPYARVVVLAFLVLVAICWWQTPIPTTQTAEVANAVLH